ncbi:MAG: rhomboid family intramembrane serine protease [Nanoarchaeota archaeon]|nr:rhomboid family intramembrane serine protease [Nanoarchaeota archaeon]MBU1027670.1 rhomboid family intramembrane serine protease [Nanoarchaeota archaeon]
MSGIYRVYPKSRRNFLSGLSVNTNIILLNVVAYIVFSLLLYLEILPIDSIAIKPSNILGGKFLWTFLTSMFMHAGLIHLFVNMFSLFFIGGLVQRILGPKRYLYFYLIAGLFAALFFVLGGVIFPEDFEAYAVGASGALFGLVGLLVLLTPNLPVYLMFIPIPIKMKYAGPGILIVLWLISQAPVVFGGQRISIGNTAHLGGFVIGLIYGLYLKSHYKNKIRMIGKHFS